MIKIDLKVSEVKVYDIRLCISRHKVDLFISRSTQKLFYYLHLGLVKEVSTVHFIRTSLPLSVNLQSL